MLLTNNLPGQPNVLPIFASPQVTTWRDITALAPSLLRIVADARELRRDYRNRWIHYESLKGQLALFVGWRARHPALRSSDAYDIAHRQVAIALGVSR